MAKDFGDNDFKCVGRSMVLFFHIVSLREYIDTVNEGLEHVQEKENALYEKAAATASSSGEKNYLEYLAEERGTHVYRAVPFMLWSSAFVAVYSFFETEIREFAADNWVNRNGRVQGSPKKAFWDAKKG